MSADDLVRSVATIEGLQKRSDLNGQRCTLLALDAPAGRWEVCTAAGEHLRVKPENLVRIRSADDAEDGRLVESEGRAMSALLDMARWLVNDMTGCYRLPELNDVHSMIDRGEYNKIVHLNSLCWTLWHEGQGTHAVTGAAQSGVYPKLVEWTKQIVGAGGPQPGAAFAHGLHQYALDDCSRWASERVHGPFFLLRNEPGKGAILISHDRKTVVHATGIATPLASLIAQQASGASLPCSLMVTLLPFAGKLVYDGILQGCPKQPGEGTAALAAELEAIYARARREGTVLPNGNSRSRAGAPPSSSQPRTASAPSAVPALSAKSRKLLQQLETISPPPPCREEDAEIWVFRRWGYSEAENPEHRVVLISSVDGSPLPPNGVFCTQRLVPSADEILAQLRAAARTLGRKPHRVEVDDSQLSVVLRAWQAEACPDSAVRTGNFFGFYPPPSAEEAHAYTSGIVRP